ncbi:MAG: hypothetical protein ACYC64_04355 [Armatimonadota bacterium]
MIRQIASMKSALLLILVLWIQVVCCISSHANGWKQKDFIITMWCPPPATDENLDVLVHDGYNLTNVSLEGDQQVSQSESLKRLDLADRHGIKSFFSSPLLHPSVLDDPVQKVKLDELIAVLKQHPAFEGYHLVDEPSASTFPDWARLARYLKERDPDHYAYINLLPCYADKQQLGVFLNESPKVPVGQPMNFEGAVDYERTVASYNEYLRQFTELINPELISYDHYPFLKGGKDGKQYFLNLELIRAASLKAGVPFLNIVQASAIVESMRLPDKNELRWLAYTTLAYGGRGISWFLYWGPASYTGMYQDGKRMPMADMVAEVNQDIKALGLELMRLKSTHVYHTCPLPIGARSTVGCPVKAVGGQYVIGLFEGNGKQNTFMIVNRDYRAASTAKLTLNMGKGKLIEYSTTKRKWIVVRFVAPGSEVDVDLIPGDGRLFQISD